MILILQLYSADDAVTNAWELYESAVMMMINHMIIKRVLTTTYYCDFLWGVAKQVASMNRKEK